MTGVVAGIGFRRGTEADEIAELVRLALATFGADAERLTALATAEDRSREDPVLAAATILRVPIIGVAAPELMKVDGRVPTRSSRIEASRGVGSLAEAAALAVAGPAGTLLLPRIASAGATCALAAAEPRSALLQGVDPQP